LSTETNEHFLEDLILRVGFTFIVILTACVTTGAFTYDDDDCQICRRNTNCSKPRAVRKKLGPGEPAISRPKPVYPKEAIDARISGVVKIEVVANEEGKVIWARVLRGHRLLTEAALKAACQTKFRPVKVKDEAVKASYVLQYPFSLR
jgi:TonB family protein